MLVLARKVGQSIMVGESIEITVIEAHGNQVRLGFTAPRSVVVRRKELLERMNEVDSAPAPDSDASDAALQTQAEPPGHAVTKR